MQGQEHFKGLEDQRLFEDPPTVPWEELDASDGPFGVLDAGEQLSLIDVVLDNLGYNR